MPARATGEQAVAPERKRAISWRVTAVCWRCCARAGKPVCRLCARTLYPQTCMPAWSGRCTCSSAKACSRRTSCGSTARCP